MTDWTKLEHAHGKATDLPSLLAELDGKDAARAAGQIAERFEVGPTSALAPLVAVLLERLEDPRRKDRASLWRLVVGVVWPEPQLHALDPFKLPKGAPKPLRQAIAAIEDCAALWRDVAAKDEAIAAAACWVAWFLPAPTEDLVDAIVARAKKKATGACRTCAVLARAMMARRGFVDAAAATPPAGGTLEERALAALAHRVTSKKLSRDGAETLAQWLEADQTDASPAWVDVDLGNLAAAALRGGADVTLTPLLVRAVLAAKDRNRLRNLELLCGVLFPEPRPLTPDTLTEVQRTTLRALIDAGVDVALPAQGVPTAASVRALIGASGGEKSTTQRAPSSKAGTASASALPPIERSIAIGKDARPAWQWFDAELAGEVTNDQLIAAFEASFSPTERWSLVRDAVVGDRGHASPAMSFVERMSEPLSPPAAEVDAFSAAAASAGYDCLPARALLCVLSLLKIRADGDGRDPVLERLASIATGGDDDAAVTRMLRALPPEMARRASQG
jgi:hypothetical protein